jgi:DNA invertase Pin-like site-specific DNA recombinase
MNQPKRCACYIRVSTERQEKEGFGLEAQKDKTLKMVQMKDWIFTEYYTDTASGLKDQSGRPELNRLIEDAKAKKFDCVVFYSLCRLGRKALLVLQLIDILSKMGIEIITCRETIDTSTPVGRFQLGIMTLLYELERENILERTKDGMEQRRLEDGSVGGRVMFGYKKDKDGKVIMIEEEAKTIRLIYHLRSLQVFSNGKMKHKYTLKKIADMLSNEHKILTPGGQDKWNESTVHKILQREDQYKGGIINGNVNGITWPKIL